MPSSLLLDEQTASTTGNKLVLNYEQIRKESELICAPLETEDYCIQTMPDVSPAKWHLAHTSWFFETFLLLPFVKNYHCFNPAYDHLFNSYYLTHGQPFSRPARGLLSRPTVAEIYRYRAAVDEAMLELITTAAEMQWQEIESLITLGLNHEQQHQELMLTDLKHVFAQNPLRPQYRELSLPPWHQAPEISWLTVDKGIYDIGHSGTGFGYDNEYPRHPVLLQPFALASRPVTNAEYLEFIDAGGYAGSTSTHLFAMSASMKPPPMPAGRASACRPSQSGKYLYRNYLLMVILETRVTCSRLLPVTARYCNNATAMSGNGPPAPMHRIRAIAFQQAPSANTMASSCPARPRFEAAPA